MDWPQLDLPKKAQSQTAKSGTRAGYVSSKPESNALATRSVPKVEIIEPQPSEPPKTVDTSKVLPNLYDGTHSQRVIHSEEYSRRTQAFVIRFWHLLAVLALLATALSKVAGWNAAQGVAIFGTLAVGGWLVLHWLEHLHSAEGIERHRISQGSRVMREQIRTDRAVRLAQIAAEQQQRSAQAHFNAVMRQEHQRAIVEQVERHSRPQSDRNRLANHVSAELSRPISQPPMQPLAQATSAAAPTSSQPPTTDNVRQWSPEDLEIPDFLLAPDSEQQAYLDTVRAQMLEFIASLYEKDDKASYLRIKENGLLKKGVRAPWTDKGSMSNGEKRQAKELLDKIAQYRWLMRYRTQNKTWQLNIKGYPTVQAAIEILDQYDTLATD